MKIFNFAKLGRTLLLSAVLVIGAVCVSNGDNPSNLVGQWVSMENGDKIELFKDGTGVIGSKNLTWKTEGKRLMLSYENKTFVSDYTLSGYELTRTYDDGNVILWVRKDKVEEYKNKNTFDFTDSRNGQKYRAVKIGGKTWMAQNLNYKKGKSWCYDDDESNCEDGYGRLYDWNTAKTACPSGWHLPSHEEWGTLAVAAGGSGTNGDNGTAGNKLKSTSGWDDRNNGSSGNGTDDFGFSALPGGYRFADGGFSHDGEEGNWWTASERGSGRAYVWNMRYDGSSVGKVDVVKDYGFSVRCVKD